MVGGEAGVPPGTVKGTALGQPLALVGRLSPGIPLRLTHVTRTQPFLHVGFSQWSV